MNENIIYHLWKDVENDTSKTSKKVYNWLNKDNLSSIELDDKVFWFELTSSTSTFPDYIYKYLKNWGKSKGYTYLYDLEKPF